MEILSWIGLFTPLIGFLLLLVVSERKLVSLIGCGSIFVSLIAFTALLTLFQMGNAEPLELKLFSWIPTLNADFAILIDSLSLLMAMIVTGVGFLIHLYSIGYMEHEEDYARFFSCMNFFIFAMLLLVLSANLTLMFVGWEGVGLASYLLIGYWYHRPAAAAAATKAFVVNRIGDLGFLLGLFLTFQTFGTSNIMTICGMASGGSPAITAITLLLFVGAIGKSAQIPLHVWLADAMEGPTPVSALIHAATMVTAGVFLVVRMHCLYLLSPLAMDVISIVGITTSLFAAFSALGQTDLKRVLAYSTVSQLGLMFLAAGVGAFYASMFHLTTHAFVKALLFLSAGNVVHMMHGSTDMEKMGGLSKIFTKTHIFFFLGVLALSGIPPFAIFFSKDLILEQEHQTGHDVLFAMGLLVSILTAVYLTRAYVLTFMGEPRLEKKILAAVKEAPWIMLGPITVLAFLAATGGFLGVSSGRPPLLEMFLEESDVTLSGGHMSTGFHFSTEMFLSMTAGFLGLGVAWILFTKRRDLKAIPLFKNAFYVDQIYDFFIVNPLNAFSRFLNRILETRVFAGSIDAASVAAYKISGLFQMMQSGQIRSYISWMLFGIFLIFAFLLIRSPL